MNLVQIHCSLANDLVILLLSCLCCFAVRPKNPAVIRDLAKTISDAGKKEVGATSCRIH